MTVGELSVSIAGDLSKLKSAFSDTQKEIDSFAKSLDSSFSKLNSSIKPIKFNIETPNLSGLHSSVSSSFSGISGVVSNSVSGIKGIVSSAFSGLGSLVSSSLSGLKSVVSSAFSEVGSIASTGLKTIGVAAAGLTATLGVGLGAGLVESASKFKTFEQSVANAASVTGKTGEEFKKAKENISAVAQELGQKTVFSSKEAADALYNLASAGMDVSTMTSAQLQPVLDMASGSQYGLEKATALTAATMSQFGLTFSDMGRVADVFSSACGTSQAKMDLLSNSMRTVGTVAKSAGMGLEETTAALDVLYNAGQTGETAGTGLRGVISSLLAPTKAATSVLQSMGLTVADVNPTTKGFANVIKTLSTHGLDATKAFQLFGQEGAPAILALTSKADDIKTFTDQLKNAGGTAATMAGQQLDTLSGSLEALSGSLENIFIKVGEALAPMIRQIADTFNAATPTIQNFLVNAVTAFVSFIQKLAPSVDSIKQIGQTIVDIFQNVFKSISGTSVGNGLAQSINSMLSSVSSIIQQYAPNIQGAITSIIGFVQNLITGLTPSWNSLKSITSDISSVFSAFFSGLGGGSGNAAGTISGVINTISGLFASLSSAISKALVEIAPTVKQIVKEIVSSLQGIDFNSVFNKIKSTLAGIDFKGMFQTIKSAFDTGKEIFTGFITNISPTFENIKKIFQNAVKLFTEVGGDISSALGSLFKALNGDDDSGNSNAGETIAKIINSVSEAVSKLMQFLADNPKVVEFGLALIGIEVAAAAVMGVLTPLLALVGEVGIWEALGVVIESLAVTVFPGLTAIITPIVSTVLPGLVTAIGALVSPFSLVVAAIALFVVAWTQNWGDIQGKTSEAVSAIKTTLQDWYTSSQTTYENAKTSLSNCYTSLQGYWEQIKTAFSSAKDGIISTLQGWQTSLQTTYNSVVTELQTLYTNLQNTWNSIVTTITNAANSVYTSLQTLYTNAQNAYNSIITSLTTLYTNIQNYWNQIQTAISNATNSVYNTLQTWYNNAQTTYNNAINSLNNLNNSLQNTWNNIKTAITNAVNAIYSTLQTWYSNAQNVYNNAVTSLNNLNNSLQNTWNNIKTAITNATNTVYQTLQTWHNNAQNVYNQAVSVLNTLNNNLQNAWNNIKNAISNATSSVYSTLQSWHSNIQGVYNNIISAIENLSNNLGNAWNNILNTISQSAQNVYNACANIPNSLYNLASDFYNAGNAMLKGLFDGISDGINQCVNNLQNGLNWLKGLLPNSPAKWGPFRELPNWDAVLYDPLKAGIKKIDTLDLEGSLKDVKSPIDSRIQTGMDAVSNITNNNSTSSAVNNTSQTVQIGPNTISNDMDLQRIFTEFERYTKLKGMQMGYI